MSEALKTFIDTNVLVYCVDKHDPAKQKRARAVLKELQQKGGGVVSTQVLQEFYVTVTKKLAVDPLAAKGMLNTFSPLELVVIDFDLIKEAVDCSVLSQLSFWDALIVVSAEKAHCTEMWTEDLNSGQIIRGVRIKNPLVRESRRSGRTTKKSE